MRAAGSPEALQERKDHVGLAVTAAINRGARPETIEALRASGFFEDSHVVAILAAHGRNYAEWSAGRPKS